ncbi:DUF3301 domain-containing protein [Thalassotalea fusca]
MENVYLLLFIALIVWFFTHMRKVAESAKRFAVQHCQKEQLQFIAIARSSNKVRFSKRMGFYFETEYIFEFSGDGQSKYQGTITLAGYKLKNIDIPAYRIN